MKINDKGFLIAINESDLVNGKLIVPKSVKEISKEVSDALKNFSNFNVLAFEENSEFCKFLDEQFLGFKNLEELDISNCKKIEEVASSAFKECCNLKKVTFPDFGSLLKKINNSAFNGCTALSEIDLNSCENLTSLCESCFQNCTNLKSVKFDYLKELELIGEYCFCGSGLKEVDFPKGVDCPFLLIDRFAFSCCNELEQADFKRCKIEELSYNAFQNCKKLKKVSFNGGRLKSIYFSFGGCDELEIMDFRNVRDVESFFVEETRGKKKKDLHVMFSDDTKWNAMAKFCFVFALGTHISLFDKNNNITRQFDITLGKEDNYMRARIGSLYFKKKYPKAGFRVLNAIYNDKEFKVITEKQKRARFLEMLKAVFGDEQVDIEFIYFLRNIGYFGFEDYKTGEIDKKKERDIDLYKVLLQKDIKAKNNGDAKSGDLNYLVYSFVMNNIANNKHKEDFLKALWFVNWRPEKNVNLAQFIVLHFDEIMKETIIGKDWENCKRNLDFDTFTKIGEASFFGILETFGDVYGSKYNNRKVVTRLNKDKFTLDAFRSRRYESVDKDDEDCVTLAGYCSNAGLPEEGFICLQNLLKDGKRVASSQVLNVCDDEFSQDKNNKNLITYKVLKKGDPLGLILGNITNCCQRFGGNGYSCMVVGATNVYSSFVTINNGEKILAQGWIWYDPNTKTIAIDNIEVPENLKDVVNKKRRQEVSDCIKRFCKNAVNTMNANGHKIKKVIIGASNTDINSLDEDYEKVTDTSKMIDCPYYITVKDKDGNEQKIKAYTDAISEGQYIIYDSNQKKNSMFKIENKSVVVAEMV